MSCVPVDLILCFPCCAFLFQIKSPVTCVVRRLRAVEDVGPYRSRGICGASQLVDHGVDEARLIGTKKRRRAEENRSEDGKGLLQTGQSPAQIVGEGLARHAETPLDRAVRNAENASDLDDRQFGEIMQENGVAVIGRQTLDRRPKRIMV